MPPSTSSALSRRLDVTADARTPLLAGSLTTMRALDYDERWLQDWLADTS